MKNILLLPLIFLLSCGTTDDQHSSTDKTSEAATEQSPVAIEPGCYGFDDGKSQVIFEIIETGDVVKGNLTYKITEKDGNVGAFKGKLSGDKLTGMYEFESEGIKSSREMAFLVKDGGLIEGYGEMNEAGDTFKNINNVSYTSSMPLKKGECKK